MLGVEEGHFPSCRGNSAFQGVSNQIAEDEGPKDKCRSSEQEELGAWHVGRLLLSPSGVASAQFSRDTTDKLNDNFASF